MCHKRLKHSYYFNVLAPLCLGVLIYMMIRPDRSVDKIASVIPFMARVRAWMYVEFQPSSYLGVFVKYHCTDFLWAYSLCWATLYEGKNLFPRLIFCMIFCTLMEAIQIFPFMRATFDWLDVLYQLLGALCAYLIYKFQLTRIFVE